MDLAGIHWQEIKSMLEAKQRFFSNLLNSIRGLEKRPSLVVLRPEEAKPNCSPHFSVITLAVVLHKHCPGRKRSECALPHYMLLVI